MKVYNSMTELVGGTPLVKLNRMMTRQNLPFSLFGKLEAMNPAGSAKDRVGLAMILDAEERGSHRREAAVRSGRQSGCVCRHSRKSP